ncbi:uncharacterized protein SPAPADRAFT_58693 [Spathaspora passalidarum NRRL Y-27907]|uniref:MAGE domain-containing protein n=1 Tax=Spathaspora passalidarum (strain NRRL Y-27907 / 11-Y1) TaxID=619300 RepID=G3AH29_SPAPN|nr:uncharacterized protein SPAPADRAFT_58693 [Spathaspora passalidarum NRRL Y-27907]EGW35459.1 hypothetical protein SPAPADRAFT_58693 [Spathaspora passalidarum NRRL Y-27907]
MPKRRREIDDSDDSVEYDEGDRSMPNRSETGTPSHELQHIVNKVIRLVLTRESKGQLIRREHINQIINDRKNRSYDVVLKEVTVALEEAYGLTLVETPIIKKKGDTSKAKKVLKPKQPYAVVNCLTPEARNLLGDIWEKSLGTFTKNDDLGQSKFYVPRYSKSKLPTSNYELVKNGILLVIVSLIILSENHISESELFRNLRKFGISTNLNVKNSSLNMNIQELLNDLIRREYLNKNITKGRIESENVVEYTLGRRSLIEFPPQSCFEYIKKIFGENFDTGMAERTLVTIERAYGVALVNESEAVTPDVSRGQTPAEQV